MERNFYNDDFDFEQFLQQKADQYKMYPSDRVWNNVNNSLRGRRRWFMGALVLLLVGTAALVTNEIISDNYRKLATELNQDLSFSTPYFFSENIVSAASPASASKTVFGTATFKVPLVMIETAYSKSISSEQVNVADDAPAIATPAPLGTIETNRMTFSKKSIVDDPSLTDKELNIPALEINSIALASVASKTEEKEPARSLWQDLLQREALLKEKRKWSFTMYASPIISYRRLTNINKSSEFTPVAVNFADNIDGYVDHKPAVGFELGSKAQYNLSGNLMIQAGLQLNYSRYSIRAYRSFAEKATLTLRRAPRADTIASYSSIRNFEGNAPEYLQNQYLQLSLPLGAELVLLGKKRLQLSVAASLQPSYLLSNNSFLISTDYKNYVQRPELTRRWNLHTNVEAFVSYKSNGLRWQVGPQFRHQTLSSYSNQYPIREYITEFGFKLGVSKTIR
jgi:hypothetical protein